MDENFASWIGRGVSREDVAAGRLIAEYRATLAPHLFEGGGTGDAPPGCHWGLAPAILAGDQLGPDGAEAKGLFLPPIALPRRMWAGGRIETFAAIRVGARIVRRSVISGLKMRQGKTGPLCFVSVSHEIEADGRLSVRERQDLVFRDAATSPAPALPAAAGAKPDVEWHVDAAATLLFRFSAFTFNAHRIHYDLGYARDSEGYPNLVVHGPLQAALLLNQAAVALGKVPRVFDYRCLAPLFAGRVFTVQSNCASGRILDANGIVTCEANAEAGDRSALR